MKELHTGPFQDIVSAVCIFHVRIGPGETDICCEIFVNCALIVSEFDTDLQPRKPSRGT